MLLVPSLRPSCSPRRYVQLFSEKPRPRSENSDTCSLGIYAAGVIFNVWKGSAQGLTVEEREQGEDEKIGSRGWDKAQVKSMGGRRD
jgi:hypothetical protein